MLSHTRIRCSPWAAIAILSTLLCFLRGCSAFHTLAVSQQLVHTLRKSPRALVIPAQHHQSRGLLSRRMQANEKPGGAGSPVLVVGEDRGLRLQVVKGLLERGASVRAMLKDASSSDVEDLRQLAGADQRLSVVQGDVCKVEELVEGMNDCRACISFDTARRPTQIKDIFFKIWDPTSEFLGAWGPSQPDVLPEEWGENFGWLDPGADAEHPWNTKFLAQCNLVDAAERTDCAHIVRISDTRVCNGPWNPRNLFDNLVQSMEVKWAHEGELALHDVAEEVGASFTLIRASDITDNARSSDQHLAISTEGVEVGREVGRADLAALCVESVEQSVCLNATLSCGWADGAEGAEDWTDAVRKVAAWDGVIAGREMHATAVFSSVFAPLVAAAWHALASGEGVTFESLVVQYRYALEAVPVLGLLLTFASSLLSIKLRADEAAASVDETK